MGSSSKPYTGPMLRIKVTADLKSELDSMSKATGTPLSVLVRAKLWEMVKTGKVDLNVHETPLERETRHLLSSYDNSF